MQILVKTNKHGFSWLHVSHFILFKHVCYGRPSPYDSNFVFILRFFFDWINNSTYHYDQTSKTWLDIKIVITCVLLRAFITKSCL